MSVIFASKIEKEQDKRLANEFAKKLVEIITKTELNFEEVRPLLPKIFESYSKKEPELTKLIIKKLEEMYSKTS